MASCHHGIQHSIRFFARRLQFQSRTVATNARKSSQPKKLPNKPAPYRQSVGSHAISENATKPTPIPKASSAPPREPAAEFPENLLVYQSSSWKTTTIAFIKMTALFSFAAGTMYFGQQIIADEEQSNWRVVNMAAWCAVPAVAISFITAPYVAFAYVHIPFHARTSLAALKRFVGNIPQTTLITLTTIQFLPWRSNNHTVKFGDLHRLPSAIGRMANLEYRPTGMARHQLDSMSTWQKGLRLVTGAQNKFFVPQSDLAMKKSRAPGVWQTIFEKIDASPRGV